MLAETNTLSYTMKMPLVPTSLYRTVRHFETEPYGNFTLTTRQTTLGRLFRHP